MASIFGVVAAVCSLFAEVFLFWYKKILGRWQTKSPADEWLDALRGVHVFEDWEHAALQLDNLKELNLWRNDPSSHSYDWSMISDRLNSILTARDDNDLQSLVDLVRSGLVRNLGNITSPKLYNRAFAGTKYLIEEYIAQVATAVEDISAQTATTPGDRYTRDYPLSTQQKLDFLHDSRQAFGRSTLVLQGGAIFGLCHLGVVKALFLRGLLPRIITGTATGALIASLVAIHTEDELPGVLRGDGIDLSAFETHEQQVHNNCVWTPFSGLETLVRRFLRFWREGYFLDVKVLEECVKANVGDLTFEEAFNRSKRILNITVATAAQDGVPTLLNYITAPNVLIWTAAVASNASTPSLYGSRQTTVLCKDVNGNIVPWAPANTFRPWTHASDKDRKSPLSRIAQLFNVNHFVVSQARPYLIPFLESDMHGPSMYTARHKRAQITGHIFRIIGLELRHRLRQLDTLALLPASIRRFLVDEEVPGASMMLVPTFTAWDFVRLLETPTRETLDYWIVRGERSVWPAVCALTVRCAVEYDIERAYQRARSLKAGGLRRKASTAAAPDLAEAKESGLLQKGVLDGSAVS
ncbi:Uu.00g040310.m01.CDS01 [Anthostomella pinea]|uniref:Uu.00g040310.m01.CDS01 n=1 Tax=Anthostomella pinea TaxID=933095 RepID=A0AAI8VAA3_9PEZI|nr:Uu.00g040310.m01.CDS01 [Anthostomella pinea]